MRIHSEIYITYTNANFLIYVTLFKRQRNGHISLLKLQVYITIDVCNSRHTYTDSWNHIKSKNNKTLSAHTQRKLQFSFFLFILEETNEIKEKNYQQINTLFVFFLINFCLLHFFCWNLSRFKNIKRVAMLWLHRRKQSIDESLIVADSCSSDDNFLEQTATITSTRLASNIL